MVWDKLQGAPAVQAKIKGSYSSPHYETKTWAVATLPGSSASMAPVDRSVSLTYDGQLISMP